MSSLLEKKVIENLKLRKIDFTIIQTALSKRIITKKKKWFFVKSGHLKNVELAFINKVKKYVEKNVNLKKYENINSKNIKFIDSWQKIKKNYWYSSELYEIDLDKAFWKCALDYQIINEEIYLQGLNDKRLSKKCRLISLGNLAKQATQYEYKNGSFLKPFQQPPQETAKLFYYCALSTTEIMQGCKFIANDGFLFYWVDAIFIQGEENKRNVLNFIEGNGFTAKIYKIDRLQLKENQLIVESEQHKTKTRVFNFFKQNKKQIYE